MKKNYEIVIGLEVHIQLNTKSKAFCGDANIFGQEANTLVSAISLAHPGTLPKANAQQIESAIRLGLAIGSSISSINYFDRKHYFYADLPKGYQITQDHIPICIGGNISFLTANQKKSVRVHHIHMEEDAGKLLHSNQGDYSQVDYNRAGVPLLELVTEPDFRSSNDVLSFLYGLRQLIRYLDISDGNMEEGSMRADCNVSVRKPGETTFGERCEIKNVNSARYAKKAIDYEAQRQILQLKKGIAIPRETREFDVTREITIPLRDKEDAKDYRYFPEPDLPPIHITAEYLQKLKSEQPKLPLEYLNQFQVLGIKFKQAQIICQEKNIAHYFLICCNSINSKPAAIANFLINKILPYIDEYKIEVHEYPLSFSQMEALLEMIAMNQISTSTAYQNLLPELLKSDQHPQTLAAKLNLLQVNDDQYLTAIIKKTIEDNPIEVKKYKHGKKGLIAFFIGQVMRQSKGKANPVKTKEKVVELLNKSN